MVGISPESVPNAAHDGIATVLGSCAAAEENRQSGWSGPKRTPLYRTRYRAWLLYRIMVLVPYRGSYTAERILIRNTTYSPYTGTLWRLYRDMALKP